MVLLGIIQAIWFIWPAYTANAFPTVMNGKRPIDFGKKIGNSRIFGDSKTIEGTIGGILFGIIIGLVQMTIQPYMPSGLGLFKFDIPIIILLSVGTLVGDIAGSFIKRRINMKPGDPALLLDQLGFLFMALIFTSLVYTPPLNIIITLLIITPVIHLSTNVVGYIIKVKKHPW